MVVVGGGVGVAGENGSLGRRYSKGGKEGKRRWVRRVERGGGGEGGKGREEDVCVSLVYRSKGREGVDYLICLTWAEEVVQCCFAGVGILSCLLWLLHKESFENAFGKCHNAQA